MAALRVAGVEDVPEIRQSPSRCIVQLGPVALTATWLRSTRGAVADGQLLVIIWRGSVAPRSSLLPERTPMRRAAPSPLALWEDVFVADGTSEASWAWRGTKTGRQGYSSTELAGRCVRRLQQAYSEGRDAS